MKKCFNGQHTLEVIISFPEDNQSEAVVRWCRYCGAVVVDIDYDNRTKVGAIMPMQFSQLMVDNTL